MPQPARAALDSTGNSDRGSHRRVAFPLQNSQTWICGRDNLWIGLAADRISYSLAGLLPELPSRYFFSWQFLVPQALIEKVSSRRMVSLAFVTALTLVSGPVDMAGLVLLVSGIVWVWHVAAWWLRCRSAGSILGLAKYAGLIQRINTTFRARPSSNN